MKGHLYYVSRFSDGEEIVQHSVYSDKSANWQYKTKDSAMEYISSHKTFVRWTDKKEYNVYMLDRAMARMKPFYEEENIEKIFAWLRNNDNVFSIKCFETLSGVKLSKTMRVRMEQLKEYYGQKYIDYENEKKLKEQEKQNEKYKKLETKFINGEDITNTEFIIICDSNNINIPARTKGYINKYIVNINISGQYTKYGKTKSNSLGWIFCRLKDKLVDK